MTPIAVALCRAGFEREAAEDLRRVVDAGRGNSTIVGGGEGVVIVEPTIPQSAFERLLAQHPPIFVRSVFTGIGPIALGAPSAPGTGARPDRMTPLVAAIEQLAGASPHKPPWRSVWVEFADTNEGKALSGLARALASRLEAALAAANRLSTGAPRRLHVLLQDGSAACVGTSDATLGSPWPLGIPRLRARSRAPSRSTQKLVEAFATFFAPDSASLPQPGQRAVDLGAAPGGWTFELAQRGLRVVAVDNGALKGDVASDPLVTHVRADGFAYRPRRPVDWLTCDIVEQPSRIADLVARWIGEGDARRAIFNLKLPMKKRYDEVRRCEARIVQRLTAGGIAFEYALRQLYHDREEVTGYVGRA